MELKLVDGDYISRAQSGVGFETVSDFDELLQRVLYKLSVPMGSFHLMPELGSRLWMLPREKKSNRRSAAHQYIAEALSDEELLHIEDVVINETETELRVQVELRYNGAASSLTVII